MKCASLNRTLWQEISVSLVWDLRHIIVVSKNPAQVLFQVCKKNIHLCQSSRGNQGEAMFVV